ncbi:MAG TPA: AAA family ATPase [Planctomycetes bacterium]|nr:AAA family ATPase [Planctomycetota bacterium]
MADTAVENLSFDQLRDQVEGIRERVNSLRTRLARYFVQKQELIDLMTICTIAQEPLLIVGPPGTAKSDVVTKYCQALGLGEGEYFEYMLTKFTEPSELIGPIDLGRLKDGAYVRKVEGKLPTARIAFLDEIFKSNSAILNTLLTIINERKFYQDGRPVPVRLAMLFAATNIVPEFEELAALRDRFALKVESTPVKDQHMDALLEKGVSNELNKALNRRPWADLCSIEDFVALRRYLFLMMAGVGERAKKDEDQSSAVIQDRKRYFPDEVFDLFKRILRTLERENRVVVSDRKFIKLYQLIRARALLFHGGAVRRDDLVLLRYVGDRNEDFPILREKVDALLRLG